MITTVTFDDEENIMEMEVEEAGEFPSEEELDERQEGTDFNDFEQRADSPEDDMEEG